MNINKCHSDYKTAFFLLSSRPVRYFLWCFIHIFKLIWSIPYNVNRRFIACLCVKLCIYSQKSDGSDCIKSFIIISNINVKLKRSDSSHSVYDSMWTFLDQSVRMTLPSFSAYCDLFSGINKVPVFSFFLLIVNNSFEANKCAFVRAVKSKLRH